MLRHASERSFNFFEDVLAFLLLKSMWRLCTRLSAQNTINERWWQVWVWSLWKGIPARMFTSKKLKSQSFPAIIVIIQLKSPLLFANNFDNPLLIPFLVTSSSKKWVGKNIANMHREHNFVFFFKTLWKNCARFLASGPLGLRASWPLGLCASGPLGLWASGPLGLL